jgi:tRNA-2-methylthio-N6-dimethylallyladenosine synthase
MSNSRENPGQEQPKKITVCIKTFGCQMNAYDTEVAEGFMKGAGFEILRADQGQIKMSREEFVPEGADVVLLNTCSVREGAEDKVYGHLGMFGKAKRMNPNLVVGLMGCMVEEHKEKLFKRFPQLDLMVGTRNIKELPALVGDVLQNRRQVSKIKQDGISIEYTDQIMRRGTWHAWLPIMTGCNKVCTFCIVPITRGSEVSMTVREVYREASRLVEEGVKWITLLGQNVNSYSGGAAFPELLERLCEINGLEAISFTTSHPHDATEQLYAVIAKNPKISRRFHLPLQSGSNRILKRMKRLHSYEEYRDKITKMREMIPDVTITTDIITGFSGETGEDHEQTAAALKEIRYDGAYIYKYSVRPGTPAANLEDDVPQETKELRNAELLTIQKKIETENNQTYVGKTLEVFVENVNPKNAEQLIGRSREEKRVIISGNPQIGKFYPVKIDSLKNETFFGEIV